MLIGILFEFISPWWKRDPDLLREKEVAPSKTIICTYDINILTIYFPFSLLYLTGFACKTPNKTKMGNEAPKIDTGVMVLPKYFLTKGSYFPLTHH